MTITSLSFAFVQYSATAPTASTPKPAATAPAPAPAVQDGCHRAGCDSPRRSPLYRAIQDALSQMMPAAATSTSAPASAGSTAAPATATTTATAAVEVATPAASAPIDLEEAMMNFARALMQALRHDSRQGHDDGHGEQRHGHHGHHHGHGRWGDPAQRVDALAQQVSGGSAAAVAVTAAANDSAVTPSQASAVPVTSTVGDASSEPVVTSQTTTPTGAAAIPTGSSGTMIFVAAIQVNSAAAAPKSPFAGLLEAFSSLQQAMGKPAASADNSLKSELAAFLQTLAQRLRGEDPATAEAATQPGALLSVAA